MENDIAKALNLINSKNYSDAEYLLTKYLDSKENKTSLFWYYLGLAYRGQSRLNEANAALHKSIRQDSPIGDAFYHLGRLHGESLSFHRAEDIRKSHFKRNILQDQKDIVYSCFGEQEIIKKILSELHEVETYCVDIGASDGYTFSNTYKLFESGWKGLCAEAGKSAFAMLSDAYKNLNVSLFNDFITPENVIDLFKLCRVPTNFGLLSLDIDSYDYYVLEKILENYKPTVLCVEITESIPPPIRFALKYNPDDKEQIGIFGQSICMFNDLLIKRDYTLIHLEYNNAFAVDNNYLPYLKTFTSQTPEKAYFDGLINRPDYQIKFFWDYNSIDNMWKTPMDKRVQVLKEQFVRQGVDHLYDCY